MTFKTYRANGQNIRNRTARLMRSSRNPRMTDIVFSALMAKIDAAIEAHDRSFKNVVNA